MRNVTALPVRVVTLALVWIIWWWIAGTRMSGGMNAAVIVGGVLLVLPIVWLARRLLDKNPTGGRVASMTMLVHYAVGFLFGAAIIRAVVTHEDWPGWELPVPSVVGMWLTITTGAAAFLTVVNLAIKGIGAPFAVALSRRLAVEWLYGWTRNPMVLAAVALLISLGLWFRSALFVLWVLLLFAPTLLVFVKVYEERELELRFGTSYREYRARTPMLLPRRPRS